MGSYLSAAITDMGRALHALRLEVPAPVADDITKRWAALLSELELRLGTSLTPDEVDEAQR